MKSKFSVYTIFAFLTETLNASKQRNNKRIWQTNSTYQNNDDSTIDGFDYLSFAKIFLLQSEPSQQPKIEILQGEPSSQLPKTATLQTEYTPKKQEAWKEHAQNRCIKETSDSKVNKEISGFKDKSLHMTCSNQTEPETAFYSSTPLPPFYIAFPEKAMKEQISKPLEYEYIEHDEVNPECSLPDTCSQSVIIDNSIICSEEVDFSAQKFLSLNKSIEVPMNNPIPSNPSISKNIKMKERLRGNYEKMLYRKTHVMMSDIPSFNLFFNQKISQKNLNEVNYESILIIKEELFSIIFTSNSIDNCNENNYSDDLKTILMFGKKLVKLENNFFLNLSRLEWLEKITEFFCLNPFKNIENTKINLLFPELNFLQNFSKKTRHILYVHYLYKVISLITYSIPLNNDKVVKYESREKKSCSKNLIDKIIFFTRILLSELFYSFQKNPEKIQIYRLLNTLHYFSTLTIEKAKYFSISLFKLKMRFILRFLFDTNIRIEDGFKNDLSLGIICQLTNPSASKLIQRRLFALICSHCSVNIYIDKATALVNIYRDRFCGNKRLETIFNQEAQNIRNLKESITSMDFSQNKHDNDIQVLKILLELEFRISHIEKAILGNSILVTSFYAKKGYEFIYNSIIKQAEKYYKDSHFSKEYFSIL
ncbi:hypothetical protein CWI36_1645p0010 [Hamiltosporidium magnivora]|uniref:Uncharacterized protein n=1 Tax=Hamiltosporidium magnivora TaxID=148818 RepID=A0A4Q9KZF7_9MICR|nr:hypothetical protein CWI36_1645p0010 [Hamiltosporidium magnivora]